MFAASRAIRSSVALLGLLAACSSSPTAPGTNPEIANNTDTFQFQTSNVVNATTTLNYDWQNTGTTANINQATTISAGTITLTVLDANGTQVYSRSLADNGTYSTSAGVAGRWKIRVTFSGASGTVNFRSQKS